MISMAKEELRFQALKRLFNDGKTFCGTVVFGSHESCSETI